MRARRRTGFTLVEIMATFPVFLLASALTVELLNSMMTLSRANAETATINSRVDSSMFQLRRDVWGSSAISADDKSVTATIGDAKIIWRIADDGSLTRTGPAGEQTWSAIATDWHFSAAPFGLMISTSNQQVPLTSQLMLARSAAP